MSRVQPTRTPASGTVSASYVQLAAAVTDTNTERIFLKVTNSPLNSSGDYLTVAEGATSSEKVLAVLNAGESITWEVDERNGINLVPQGKISLKNANSTKAYFAETAVCAKSA